MELAGGLFQRIGRHKCRTLLACFVACLLVGGFIAVRKDLATWYVAREFRLAETADEELAASKRLYEWLPFWTYWYTVEVEDVDGKEMKPWTNGEWERASVVEITWENGETARRKILNRHSFNYICGK
jgi:hypothetical protein